MKNEIRITYPKTEFLKLNQELKIYIGSLFDEFLDLGESIQQPEFSYSLDSYYEKYTNDPYFSYVFFTSMNTGGAHPNNTIKTFVYQKEEKKVITISDLEQKNPNLLSILSEESRKLLRENPKIEHTKLGEEMLLEGTKPTLDNFQNFAFTKDGMLIFLEPYQVAPYAEGSFRILIPNSKLGFS